MKKQLLVTTSPVSFPFNVLWTEPPRDIQLKNNSVFFTACADTTCDKMPLFIEGG